MKEKNIGIFDSGVGGITVLKEIMRLLPGENVLYYGDSINAPYGNKSPQDIQKLCLNILKFLVENNSKIIVIACNTATAVALEILRENCNIPVVGIISSGARAIVEIEEAKSIAIMATEVTVKSEVYLREIKKLKEEIDIFQLSCPLLVPEIEKNWKKSFKGEEILQEYISKIPKETDTLVLGCTHFPIIKSSIKKYYRGRIIDPAKEIAWELKNILTENDLLNGSGKKGNIKFYISGNKENFKKVAKDYLEIEIEEY